MRLVFFEIPIDIINETEQNIIKKTSIFTEIKNKKFIWLNLVNTHLYDYISSHIKILKNNKEKFEIKYNHLGKIAGNRLLKNTIHKYPDIALIMLGDDTPIYVKIKQHRIINE